MLAIIIILGILGICMLGFGIVLMCEKEKKVGFWYLFFTGVVIIIEIILILIEVNSNEENSVNKGENETINKSITKVLIYNSQDTLIKEYYGNYDLISDDKNYIIIINKS